MCNKTNVSIMIIFRGEELPKYWIEKQLVCAIFAFAQIQAGLIAL